MIERQEAQKVNEFIRLDDGPETPIPRPIMVQGDNHYVVQPAN